MQSSREQKGEIGKPSEVNNAKKQRKTTEWESKKIEENNRMGKTSDLFKKRDTKGTFHAKMGSRKDRNVQT